MKASALARAASSCGWVIFSVEYVCDVAFKQDSNSCEFVNGNGE